MEFLESAWDRSGRRDLGGPWESPAVYPSKVMAWVAVDRAVKAVERFGLEAGDVGAPCGRRSTNRYVGKDTMPAWGHLFSYGGKNLDAGLLMIPLVGFFQRAAEDRSHS